MTWRDMMAVVLMLIFISSFVYGAWGDRAAEKFLKWLYTHKRQIWRELGRPGTFFFKGDPDNSFLSRASAWASLKRSGGLKEFHRKLSIQKRISAQKQISNEEAMSHLRQYYKYNRLSGLFLFMGVILLFILVVMEKLWIEPEW
jgi:hypothetical protein